MIPRRIPDYPDAFAGWNQISSFGSLVSVIATCVFAYIIYDILSNGQEVLGNPFRVPAFFQNREEFYVETQSADTIEWSLRSPTSYHAFHILPVQS